MYNSFGQYGVGTVIIALLVCIPWCLVFPLYCLGGDGNITKKIPGNII